MTIFVDGHVSSFVCPLENSHIGGMVVTFREVLAQVIEWLQQDKRVSYRALKLQFDLDDATFEALKEELLYAHPVGDDAGRGLIWTDDPAPHAPDARRGPDAESRFHLLL